MSLRRKFFAATYDRFITGSQKAGLADMRQTLLKEAHGDVLEIGAGTGLNVELYGTSVSSLTLTEPDPSMVKRLEHRASQVTPPAKVLRAPAEDLPFEDGSFDTVVATLVFCGVDDQPRAVREAKRVLRPGGTLLFLEHVRSSNPEVARFQDKRNWLNRLVVMCDCNRATQETMRQAGFELTRLDDWELPKAPKFARPAIVGSARA